MVKEHILCPSTPNDHTSDTGPTWQEIPPALLATDSVIPDQVACFLLHQWIKLLTGCACIME